jgi:hypothetical protein
MSSKREKRKDDRAGFQSGKQLRATIYVHMRKNLANYHIFSMRKILLMTFLRMRKCAKIFR